MKIPAMPQKGKPVSDTIRDLINYVRATRVTGIQGGRLRNSPNGITIEVAKSQGSSQTASSSGICKFGTTTTTADVTPEKQVVGGVIYCGDKNFNVSNYTIDEASDGTWLLQIKLDCESNRDDDGEIFLPGIKTSSDTPEWNKKTWTDPTDYDDNTNPNVSDGLGTIVIPIGKITVTDNSAVFEPVACGNIVIGQCAGILSSSRI